ncbi:universal stress protein A-like protein [Juglans regia]|uniref:Universal stress protein A-like protein n=2 Tax=Juglans regia TaxID=51240 RepID=A0A2I4DH63_JUGRE|nr:universal stress protein A-like protein [Juglans regia]
MDNEAERKSNSTGKKKVMVAIDESECSRCALQWALDNLRETIANSDLLIFTVQPIVDFGYAYASTLGAAPPELMRSIQENHQKIASALLEKAKEMCANHGIIPAEMVTEVGDPKEAICATVEKLNIQLLVLGSHSRGVIKRAFLGSVSNYCVHNAKCPVLVVKKPV